ncbi:MAG: MFS transporter [Hyphomonadaceae bacterium]|nr:MFS transporter [Hyphomonadaceae bacterium]
MRRLPSFAIFRHAALTRFMATRLCVVLGMQMQLTAMGWQVYDAARNHGQDIAEAALLLGLIGLAQFIPLLLLSLLGGQAADRYNRKGIILICLASKLVVAAILALGAQLGPAGVIPIIFSAAILTGAFNAFLPAAQSSLLPMLVPREELPQAIAWNSLIFQTGVIVGPALGGLLYGVGAFAPYAGSALLFVLSLLLLWSVRAPKQAPVEDARTLGMIAEGLRFVWSNKIVLGAISLDLVVVLLAGAVALLPVFARDILHAGPSELGVLRSAMGVGAAIVAVWLAIAPLRRNVGRWMYGATILFGLATIVFGLSQNLWLTAGALAVAGAADMISVFVRHSLIQLATPDAMRGRVGAVSFVFISASNELGDFEAGLTARLLGPVYAVTLGGALAVAASLGWMRLFPDLIRADGFEPRVQNVATAATEEARRPV